MFARVKKHKNNEKTEAFLSGIVVIWCEYYYHLTILYAYEKKYYGRFLCKSDTNQRANTAHLNELETESEF